MYNRTDDFLNMYKQLEQSVKKRYKLKKEDDKPIYFLMNRPEYRYLYEEIDFCREIRNVLSHNPRVGNNLRIEPNDEMISLLQKILDKVENPPKAYSIAIKAQDILSKNMSDHILPTMKAMNDYTYTHIPIVDNGVVTGVFSENTLLSYLVDEEIVSIEKDMTFEEMSKYLPLNAHRAESFRFVPRNALLSDVTSLFEEAIKKNDRIGMVFITNSGKPTEKLLGIITAWDIAGINN